MQGGKHILFFMPESQGGGGAERMTLTYAGFAKEMGYSVEIVVVGKTDSGVKLMSEGEFPVSLINVNTIWSFGTIKIFRLIKSRRPQVVFSSFHYLNPRLILAASMVGNTRIVVRCDNGINSVNRITRYLVKMTYGFADVVIAQTEEMKEELIKFRNKLSKEKVVVLNNPICSKRIQNKLENAISPYPDGSINIVTVTRFSRQKGLDILIRSFVKVHQCAPEITLNIVGGFSCNDPIKRELDQLIVDHNLQENIVFWGFQSNPYPFVKFANCFVLSSRWEGLPNALIEAQFLRVPSVSTACIPSISHIIQNGVTGFIVPMNDSDAFAKAVLEALNMGEISCIYKGTTAEEFCAILS